METKTITRTLSAEIARLPDDLRLELVLLELLKAGLPPDELLIEPLGAFQRTFSRDVEQLKTRELPSGRQWLALLTNRDGLYDRLPESVFHQPANRNPMRSAEQMVLENRQRQQEEDQARLFFLPYEQEIHWLCTCLLHQELQALTGPNETSRWLEEWWGIELDLQPHQAWLLLLLLPHAHRLTGNRNLTRFCLEALLNVPVRLEERPSRDYGLADLNRPGLGQIRVGTDSMLGQRVFDGLPRWHLILGPVTGDELMEFLPAARNLRLLKVIEDYFIPAGLEVEREIQTEKKIKPLRLDAGIFSGRLGYTSSL